LTSKAYSNQFTTRSTDLWIMGLQVLGVSSVIGLAQLHRHHHQPAGPWHDHDAPAGVHVDDAGDGLPDRPLVSGDHHCARRPHDGPVSFGSNFFEVSTGGLPILWQHLFWIFGHPEVYILILPAMGIVSEILPTFSRKPLFGYPIIVFSGAVIGLLGFGVWSHHMFTTGMGTVATAAFSLATMAIAVPTGVKIFNWIGTLWGGQLQMRTPMMFALGFVWMFMMGGFSGIMHSAAPADSQQQDSYFVVAHFHYVLIGGSIFALLAGIHYWFPLIFGRKVSEFWGKLSFWVIFVGFNVTFFPMHFLGLNGMPRRTFTYDGNMGWNSANMIATIGAMILGIGIAVYFAVMVYTYFKGEKVGRDPWGARTLEWSIPNPPPEYNFAVTPTVHARDAFWYEKHHQAEIAKEKGPARQGRGISWRHPHAESSLGSRSSPMGLLTGSLFFTNHNFLGAIAGGVVVFIGVYLWAWEGPGGYHLHVDKDGNPIDSKDGYGHH
jgi:cytochrome c oxidase subunit 1